MARLLERLRLARRRVRRRVLLHRRLLAALLTGGAVLAGLQAAAPAPPATVTVWTAAHDLPSGTVLAPADLVASRYPPSVVPQGAVRDVRPLLGATLAAPMRRGEPLTHERVLDEGLLHGYPGTTAVPLRIADAAVVGLLRVGDEVSFVVADPDGRTPPSRLVDAVPVVALPRLGHERASADAPGALVVVAVPDAAALDVAARAATGVLVPVWGR